MHRKLGAGYEREEGAMEVYIIIIFGQFSTADKILELTRSYVNLFMC